MANILVVEDDVDLRAAYKFILEKDKHKVKAAANGQEALKVLKNYKPELVLLDLLMPVMGGLEFLKTYNPSKTNKDVKILVLSNLENSPEIDQAYALGAKHCAVKAWTSPKHLGELVAETLA